MTTPLPPRRTDLSGHWRSAPHRLLDFDGPTRSFEHLAADFLYRPIFTTFREVAQRFAGKTAVSDGGLELTYRQLLDASCRIADLISTTTSPGDAVGILMPSSVAFAAAAFGCLAAGRPYVALDSRYPQQRNMDIIERAGLSVLIVDSTQGGVTWDLPRIFCQLDIARILAAPTCCATDLLLQSASIEMPAVILYTSGSSGRPKGIVNSQRNLLQRVRQYVDASHIDNEDVLLLSSSFCTIAGTREALTALLTGARLVIVDPERAGLRAICVLIRQHNASVMYGLSGVISAAISCDAIAEDLRSLRIVRLGGDRVSWDDYTLIRKAVPSTCFIQIGYASTENTGTQWFVPVAAAQNCLSVPVGYILPGITFAILSDDGSPVTTGEVGELVIRSRYVALGQWEEGRCVPGAIINDPNPDFRIIHTGDLVRMDKDDLIEVVGRKDRQIKINGKRVEPAELEIWLRRFPQVSDAAVIASRSDEHISLVAFVAPMPSSDLQFRNVLVTAMKAALPSALQPARLHLIDVLPRLPSAKLDVQSLYEADIVLRAQDTAPAPAESRALSSRTLSTVERLWCKVLRISAPMQGRGWDDSGGDSLKLLRLVFELEHAFGRDLPLERFEMSMKVGEFAAIIDDLLAPCSLVVRNDDRPTVFMLPGLSGDNPGLASLRSELRQSIHFTPIHYPNWREMIDKGCTIESLAERAVGQIIASVPEGDIHLVSYSMGGAVALIAAARFVELGRRVGFFGVIDTNISGISAHVGQGRLPTFSEVWRTLLNVLRGNESMHARACQQFARWLISRKNRLLLGYLARSQLTHLPEETRFVFQNELAEALRWQAMQSWMAQRDKLKLPGRAILFRSQEARANVPADLGWSNYFDEVDTIHVDGNHLDLLRLPYRTQIRAHMSVVMNAVTTCAMRP